MQSRSYQSSKLSHTTKGKEKKKKKKGESKENNNDVEASVYARPCNQFKFYQTIRYGKLLGTPRVP